MYAWMGCGSGVRRGGDNTVLCCLMSIWLALGWDLMDGCIPD